MNNLQTLIPYASYKYHIMAVRESLVYSTVPCDPPISIPKAPDRSNTVNPALPEIETCKQTRRMCYYFHTHN